jgi:uncharacterized protein (TIGR02145 family)
MKKDLALKMTLFKSFLFIAGVFLSLSIGAFPYNFEKTNFKISAEQAPKEMVYLKDDLAWMRCAVGQTWHNGDCIGLPKLFTWPEVKNYMDQLPQNTGWRIPTAEELISIRSCQNGIYEERGVKDGYKFSKCDDSNRPPAIDLTEFPFYPSKIDSYNTFWSSTPVEFDNPFRTASNIPKDPQNLVIEFIEGRVYRAEIDRTSSIAPPSLSKNSLRLVRDYKPTALELKKQEESKIALEKTGVVKIGEVMWMRCQLGAMWTGSGCARSGSKYTWNQALEIKQSFAGYNDWRLPTKEELLSLRLCSNGIEEFDKTNNGIIVSKCKDGSTYPMVGRQNDFPNLDGIVWSSTRGTDKVSNEYWSLQSSQGWLTTQREYQKNSVLLIRDLK